MNERDKVTELVKGLPRMSATLAENWNNGNAAAFKKAAHEVKEIIRRAEGIFKNDLWENLK